MNRCTQLDEMLQKRVSRQPLEAQRILRPRVKGQGHFFR